MDVAKLAVQCGEKSEQEMVWALAYQLRGYTKSTSKTMARLGYEARKMCMSAFKCDGVYGIMQVIGIIEKLDSRICCSDKNYAKDDFVVVLEKKINA